MSVRENQPIALIGGASVGPERGCDPHATPSDCGDPRVAVLYSGALVWPNVEEVWPTHLERLRCASPLGDVSWPFVPGSYPGPIRTLYQPALCLPA